jgi:hypothetical protein
MNSMKKMMGLAAGALLAISAANPASAVDIAFDPDGPGPISGLGLAAGTPIPNLTGLDWNTGNALAEASVPLVVGAEFTTYYQARLAVFQIDPGAGFGPTATNFTDLATGTMDETISAPPTFEWTVAARFKERVTAIVGTTAFFEVVNDPDNYLKIFYDDTADANDTLGTGFIDGDEILSASIVVQDNGSFTQNGSGFLDTAPATGSSVHGSGSFNITAVVDSHDNDFLDIDSIILGGGQVKITLITSTLELPFGPADPADQFEVVGGLPVIPVTGATNGVNGPDFIFEADANQVFDVFAEVPEPATLGLMGLMGLALAGRRRRTA